jgi:hypothetical protein
MKQKKFIGVKFFTGLSFFVSILHGCSHQQIKFNRAQWNDGDIEIYPYRDAMLNDLFTNYHLKGMSYRQLTKLLGEPSRWENVNIDSPYYVINTDYGNDIDPVYTKTLTIYLDKDSVVASYKVKEWKKHD